MSTLVGTKGQVTIERDIRDALGIRPGWRALQRMENGHVVLEFLPPPHQRSLAGILTDATTVRIPSTEQLEDEIDRAWGKTVREEWQEQPGAARSGDTGS